MKFIFVGLITGMASLLGYVLYREAMHEEKTTQLATALERERSFNVRRARRLKWMQAPEKINLAAVAEAAHLTGIRPSAAAALLFCENGPEFLESGAIDKTDFFALHVPIEKRSAVEGARTLNRMAWEWFAKTPEGKRALLKMLTFAGKPYTHLGLPEQRAWAMNMAIGIDRFEDEIKDAGPAEREPLQAAMKTPTPDYGYSVKATRSAKRAKQAGGVR